MLYFSTKLLPEIQQAVALEMRRLRRSSTRLKEQRRLVLFCMFRGNVRSQVRLVLQSCGLADIFNNVKTL